MQRTHRHIYHWATWAMPPPPLNSYFLIFAICKNMAKMQHYVSSMIMKIVKIVATRCHI